MQIIDDSKGLVELWPLKAKGERRRGEDYLITGWSMTAFGKDHHRLKKNEKAHKVSHK